MVRVAKPNWDGYQPPPEEPTEEAYKRNFRDDAKVKAGEHDQYDCWEDNEGDKDVSP